MFKTGRLQKLLQLLISLGLFAGLALSPAQPAYAATYTVNSLADPGDGVCGASCTLREAITAANATAAADTIQISISGTITLTASLPGIEATGGKLTIDGTGLSIHINGNDHDRVLWTKTNANLTLKHLIIEDGTTTTSGGGIYASDR